MTDPTRIYSALIEPSGEGGYLSVQYLGYDHPHAGRRMVPAGGPQLVLAGRRVAVAERREIHHCAASSNDDAIRIAEELLTR